MEVVKYFAIFVLFATIVTGVFCAYQSHLVAKILKKQDSRIERVLKKILFFNLVSNLFSVYRLMTQRRHFEYVKKADIKLLKTYNLTKKYFIISLVTLLLLNVFSQIKGGYDFFVNPEAKNREISEGIEEIEGWFE